MVANLSAQSVHEMGSGTKRAICTCQSQATDSTVMMKSGYSGDKVTEIPKKAEKRKNTTCSIPFLFNKKCYIPPSLF